jgi:hypothetical protein
MTYFPFLPLPTLPPPSYLPITSYTLLPHDLLPFSPTSNTSSPFSLPTTSYTYSLLTYSLSSHFCYTSYPLFPFLPLPTRTPPRLIPFPPTFATLPIPFFPSYHFLHAVVGVIIIHKLSRLFSTQIFERVKINNLVLSACKYLTVNC